MAAKKHVLKKKVTARVIKPATTVQRLNKQAVVSKKKIAKRKVTKRKAIKKNRTKPTLTEAQQSLVDQLLLTPCIKEAAGIIGMAYGVARRMVTKGHIIDALEAAREKVSLLVQKKAAVDPAYVLRQSVKLHERCMQEVKPVMARGEGGQLEETGEFKFEHTGAAKALELIGKHRDIKAFDTTLNLDVKNTGMDKLMARIAAGAAGLPSDNK